MPTVEDPLESPKKRLLTLYLLAGDATPLVDDAVQGVEAVALLQIRLPALNHQTHRGAEGWVGALASARTLPMMDGLRLVTLRDCQEVPAEGWAALVAYASDPSSSSVLVITGTGFPRASPKEGAWPDRFRTAAGDRARVQVFASADVAPVEYARARALGKGKRMDYDAARLLVEVAGGDLRVLAGEVDKLAIYVGDSAEIDEAAVSEAGSQLAAGNLWDLTTAVARRNRPLALSTVARLLDDGDDPRHLLGMLAWQWREILRYAEFVRAGQSDSEIGRQIKLRPELLRAIRPRVGKDLPGASVVFGRLARAWADMNGHKAGEKRILEALVLELTSP